MINIKGILKSLIRMKTGIKITVFCKWDAVSQDDTLDILQAVGTEGYVTFSPDKLKAEVEEAMKNRKIGINEEGKSKSEILRGRLFQLWQNSDNKESNFERFYESKMDGLIYRVQQGIDRIEIDRLDDYYATKKQPK